MYEEEKKKVGKTRQVTKFVICLSLIEMFFDMLIFNGIKSIHLEMDLEGEHERKHRN